MTSASASSGGGRQRSGVRRAVGTLLGVLAPFIVAVLVWIVAAPRSELVSVGEGGAFGFRIPAQTAGASC